MGRNRGTAVRLLQVGPYLSYIYLYRHLEIDLVIGAVFSMFVTWWPPRYGWPTGKFHRQYMFMDSCAEGRQHSATSVCEMTSSRVLYGSTECAIHVHYVAALFHTAYIESRAARRVIGPRLSIQGGHTTTESHQDLRPSFFVCTYPYRL